MQAVMCKSQMRIYTILRVFPHAEIHAEMCIPACGNTRGPHAEIQVTMRNYTVLCYFHMWKYTFQRVSPHMEIFL